jgi:hypothetical protein
MLEISFVDSVDQRLAYDSPQDKFDPAKAHTR